MDATFQKVLHLLFKRTDNSHTQRTAACCGFIRLVLQTKQFGLFEDYLSSEKQEKENG